MVGEAAVSAGVESDVVGWELMSEPKQSWTGMPKIDAGPLEVAEASAGAGQDEADRIAEVDAGAGQEEGARGCRS